MLEKINHPDCKTISSCNRIVTKYIKEIINYNKDIIYYEIGIGVGATLLDVAKIMSNNGQIFIFSRKCDCEEIKKDLKNLGYTNINNDWCSSDKIYSGYHFEIADAILQKKLPLFDVCYLDGGHVFHLDAPTTCLIKELCKINGYIIFDDYNWSLKFSPTLNPQVRKKTLIEYDDNQINKKHIKMICQLFMDTDIRFEKTKDYSEIVAVYKKIKE